MKRISTTLIAGAMAVLVGPAMADSMSLTQFKPHVMPVLVEVNAQGHVTKILPSVQLTPKFQRMLAKDIDHWVVRPASVKGRAVDSQVIMGVALKTSLRKDGKYDVSFAYVSMVQSPFGGAAHWSWKNGYELALVSDSHMMNFRSDLPREVASDDVFARTPPSSSSFSRPETSSNQPSASVSGKSPGHG